VHNLIKRQKRRYLKNIASLPEEFQEFIKAVDKAYHENDADRIMLERAFDLSSQELIQVNEELKESEEKYRLIAENTADLIVAMDMNLRFTYISPSIMRTHGFTVEEAMNMTLDQVLTPKSMQNLLTVSEEEMKLEATGTADPGRIRSLEIEGYKKDGSIIWMESSVSNQRDKENKPIGILSVNRDITERKQVEKKLMNSEEKFRMLAESSPLGIMMHQGDRWIYANRAAVEISGYTEEELYSMDFWDIVHPDYRDMIKERGHNRQQGKILPRDYEFKIIAKNGLEKWVILTGNPIKYEDKPTAVISVTDITERKIIEAALMESEIKYRRIFESFEDLYYQTDEKGIIRVLSPSLYRLTGWSPDELIGKPVTDVYVSPNDQGGLLAEISQSGFLRDYEVFLKKKDGTQTYASLTASILTDPDGRLRGIAGTLRDITERKQAEEERKQSFERLRKALGATVQSISLTVEMKDPYTAGHQQRVSDLTRAIATEMGLSADRRDFIRTASSIHDIGKISVPSEILSKPTKLTELEFSLIKTHSQSGHDILKDIDFPWPVADVVLQHHERMNGSGYPQGLKGDDILLEARIMAVADVVEAIASHRPYRPSLGIDFALEEISRNKGILYDADVVDACLKLFQEKSYTLLVLKK
jgi:PAS domain S-box-containing protein